MDQEFLKFESDSEESQVESNNNTLVKENGPWVRNKTYDSDSFLVRLHEELIDFYNYMHATKEEHEERIKVIDTIRNLCKEIWPGSETFPYGSFTTDLYLPSSDIDIVVLNVGIDPVNVLADELKSRNLVSHIETITSARIPIIKCTEISTGTKVDICFEVTAGLETAKLVKSYLTKWPILRPLIFFLKYFLQWRGLNDTYQGGVGSFMLQLMLVSMIQLHPIRNLHKWLNVDKDITLGAWLLSFFELYGQNFNYSQVGISVSGKGKYYRKLDNNRFDPSRPYLLSIENPLDESIDIGKNSFAIMRVKKAFEYAYNQLLLKEVEPEISLLSRIVGVRSKNLLNRGKN